MKRILLFTAAAGVAAALVAVTLPGNGPGGSAGPAAPAADPGADQSVESRFVGHYELVSLQVFPDDGEAFERDYLARIVYDEHGNMAAVGMPRDLPERARQSGGEWTRGEGFGYFGPFTVDPDAGTVTHHVQGSPVDPDWVGTDQVRYYEFDGERLMLSLKDEDGRTTATLTWRPLGSGTDES